MRLPRSFVLSVLILAACQSSAPANDWLPRAQQLVAGSVSAHTQILTMAGNSYKAEGNRCMAASSVTSTSGEMTVDGMRLFDCMRPANEARDRIESAATAYRDVALSILTASSWADVLARLPGLRDTAAKLASATHGHGTGQAEAMAMLAAPIDAAERGGAQ